MKFIKSITILFLIVFLFGSIPSQDQTAYLEIAKFVDGDTFWVKYPYGKEEKIRFIGMNTPESRNTGRTKIEYFGKEASENVRQLPTVKKVRLEYDVHEMTGTREHLPISIWRMGHS
ncbi:thermonuclease family protein [Algoriphagus antarcticus]|uniref:Uncharacterized protein n=1 Tax=Algoriphagus antarcticus TaxID=238540 RepID=A0A3E0DZ26_9BACT|nr:hypothetical protein [Algoriphagus antarcticus]REG90703.1 hypothetical protein C8N25_106204 [Algoriphagus antarcticus]